MHIHILGIGGTFMSALALLARDAGFTVSGCDANCYPPISTLLTEKGITWHEGYDHVELALSADCVIVGNVISRGLPVIEAVLNAHKPYYSGPEWLAKNILSKYKVMAVAGTHGKTTTTSMLAFILHEAGLTPGFLIGGVASNFNSSACLGKGAWFVIEADEYDSAFFDKRPKLLHYKPDVAILNNLEFDHADIYPNLEAIQQQFHYYLKTIPSEGVVIKPRDDAALNAVLAKGCYSKLEDMAFDAQATWKAELLTDNGSAFAVLQQGKKVAEVHWPLIGQFNVENGLAAIAASTHAGVSAEKAAAALSRFKPVKRRLEVVAVQRDITIYDDFAHHPTAIAKTIHALKTSGRHQRILVVLEFGSYTMKTGVHADKMAEALQAADGAFVLKPKHFNLETKTWNFSHTILADSELMVKAVVQAAQPGDALLVMSNKGFENMHQRLAEGLQI